MAIVKYTMARTITKKRRRHSSTYTGLTVKDVWGDMWFVAERRPTNYKFSVYMGWPITPGGVRHSGRAAVIVTEALARHMRSHAQRPYAYPLPIGTNARRRIREELGCGPQEWADMRMKWWLDRINDLGSMSSEKFVAKHGKSGWTRMGTMSRTLVWQMRTSLIGRQRHEIGWWKSPKVASLVLSDTPLEEIARRLDLSPVSVYGIRYRLNKLAGRTRPRKSSGTKGGTSTRTIKKTVKKPKTSSRTRGKRN